MRSAAARYCAACTLAVGWIQGSDARARSGDGTAPEPSSPQRSACIASARVTRWRISACVMQRSRLTRQRIRSITPIAAASRILSMPDLEVQNRPEELLVVLPAVQVLGEHTVQDARVVIGPGDRRPALQMIQKVFAHLA